MTAGKDGTACHSRSDGTRPVALRRSPGSPRQPDTTRRRRTRLRLITESELAQTLVFLAEYVDRMNTLHNALPDDPATLQIMERGWLSKYAYQVCVLERRFSRQRSQEIVTAILSMVPTPDASILLRVNEAILRTRIAARPMISDDAYWSFLRRADELMVGAVADGYDALVIDTSNMTVEDVARVALPVVSALR